MAPAPAPEFDDLRLGEEEHSMSVRSFLIAWYCVEVVEASRALVSVRMVCCSLVAPAPAPAPELDDLELGEEEIFISVRSFFIAC